MLQKATRADWALPEPTNRILLLGVRGLNEWKSESTKMIILL
jgi:hypothetical protein